MFFLHKVSWTINLLIASLRIVVIVFLIRLKSDSSYSFDNRQIKNVSNALCYTIGEDFLVNSFYNYTQNIRKFKFKVSFPWCISHFHGDHRNASVIALWVRWHLQNYVISPINMHFSCLIACIESITWWKEKLYRQYLQLWNTHAYSWGLFWPRSEIL